MESIMKKLFIVLAGILLGHIVSSHAIIVPVTEEAFDEVIAYRLAKNNSVVVVEHREGATVARYLVHVDGVDFTFTKIAPSQGFRGRDRYGEVVVSVKTFADPRITVIPAQRRFMSEGTPSGF
jgi:hypothetical protein